MFAIGLFLFTLRNQAPVVLSEIVSNLFLLPGLMLFSLVMLFDQLARAVHRLWLRGDAC